MSKRKQRKFAMLASGVAVLLGVQSAWVAAQEEDEQSPFSFSVSQTFSWDDNMYRLPDGEPPRDGSDRSDVVSNTSVGINFDKTYSRQSFHAGISATHSVYRKHSNLDNTAPDANLRWDWRAGDRWSGVLGYGWSESFVGFENTYGYYNAQQEKVMHRLSRANASADFWWHPNWATGFSFSDVRSDYRDDARQFDQYEAQQVSLNLTYRPSTGNRVVFSLRGEEGLYLNRKKKEELVPGETSLRDWERYDAQVSAQWQLTGATKLSGYTGYTQRKYDLASNRDFSGVTGKIALNWMPSGKAIVDLSWRREIGADADYVSNYAVTQGWALQPTWVISSKVRLGATFEYLDRDYGGDPGYPAAEINPREAKTTAYGLNLQYMPTPNANIALGYRQQKRESDKEIYDSIYGFDARTVWLSGSLSF
ncbi:MAG: outer membrane beta-barrel protein [Azoarcus sp.]|jgi:exopolysaccharide biosynthesis operon protein EpsL|nr:outer membrane beta-barrel protein [Azoarcus sp.]